MNIAEIREHYKGLLQAARKGSSEREAYYTIYIRLIKYTNRVDATTGMSRVMLVGKPEHQEFYKEALKRLRGEL